MSQSVEVLVLVYYEQVIVDSNQVGVVDDGPGARGLGSSLSSV